MGISDGMLGGLMKQAEELKQQMQEAQERAAQRVVIGESGGGLVKVHVTGALEVQRVELDPRVMSPDDHAMAEDLIAAAIRDGISRARRAAEDELGPMAQALKAAGLGG